jgi:TolB-like protein/class 3 adenylate cyclase
MPGSSFVNNDFLRRLTEVVENNLSNEQFGVSELADEMGMSRSNLLRRVKKMTDLSVSQFIRNVRLKHAMEMLSGTSHTVSEVAYKVGFSSTSYFIKCFRELYGYPPGEAAEMVAAEGEERTTTNIFRNHKLAAIMFTDIEGYTALMQKDEAKAVEYRNRHREIFNSTIRKYNGKILQYYGDGTLSTFSSAIDAVKCGIDMQLAFRQDPHIPVRVGIHTGDIIFTEDDIIGDGVNVASRVESLAVVGSVFISGKVYDEVKNQAGIQSISMGLFELKNVDKPLEVYAISNPGLVVPERASITGKLKDPKGHAGKKQISTNKAGILWLLISLLVLVGGGYLIYLSGIFQPSKEFGTSADINDVDKSIAVLPFINDSDDSTNVYLVNGLMESILNNLQKIKDLRVISRTSVEKYRNKPKLISEIAGELNVRYLVEGSGQKIGDNILLNIQLIDASNDQHLWSEQYNRVTSDIFSLQSEIAKNIADHIEVILTPEEEELIEKKPTENLVAYDFYLKGTYLLFRDDRESLEKAITYFREAISHDDNFAHAYAAIAIAYYSMDKYQAVKAFSDTIELYADKALQRDPQLPQGLIAKGFFFMNQQDYHRAVPYLEKALEFNPNSAIIIGVLADFYANKYPDTKKYLEYALRGIRIDIGSYDSITASFTYLHVSSAFIQSGFVREAIDYVDKSLDYYPGNLYAEYLSAFINFAVDADLVRLKDGLVKAFSKDSTRLDIMQEVGKAYYFLHDYENAYPYYARFAKIRDEQNLNIYRGENGKIGYVYLKMGLVDEADRFFKDFYEYAENDQTNYKHLTRSAYYAYTNEKDKALEHLAMFTRQDNYYYWIILFLKLDPIFDNIKDLPEFDEIFREMEDNFWKRHQAIKESLEVKGLI